ncbi:MAG: hypothetical protein ACOY8P_02605 [Thermodesulfobacteriota bacterium]
MTDFKHEWDTAMALEVLQSPNVDGATWAEAVKWLLFYGPPELRALINAASHFATSEHFPELMPTGYDETGTPCYDRQELAAAVGVSEEKLAQRLAEWEAEAGESEAVIPPRVHRVH